MYFTKFPHMFESRHAHIGVDVVFSHQRRHSSLKQCSLPRRDPFAEAASGLATLGPTLHRERDMLGLERPKSLRRD
jgi:hypothetical protein